MYKYPHRLNCIAFSRSYLLTSDAPNPNNLDQQPPDENLSDLLVRRYQNNQLDNETDGELLNTHRWIQQLRQQRRLFRRRLSTAI